MRKLSEAFIFSLQRKLYKMSHKAVLFRADDYKFLVKIEKSEFTRSLKLC